MEYGFYHPERGYWQAIDGDAETLLSAYPDGTVQVPLKPGANHEWQDGAWVYVPPPLEGIKAGLKARLDIDAETERLKYITPGAGQAMEYQQAAAEAEALLTAVDVDPGHDPDPAQYPMLAASIGIDGDTLVDVATTVATMHGQWRAIGSSIRAARLAGKAAIDAAETAEAARAAFDAVEWPEPPEA